MSRGKFALAPFRIGAVDTCGGLKPGQPDDDTQAPDVAAARRRRPGTRETA